VTVWSALVRALSAVEERPRLASGLESAQYTTRVGRPYVVVHNPRAETYVRLEPREFELLELMDGTRSVKQLVVSYYQRNGVLALPRVTGLVRLLRAERFLTQAAEDAYTLLARRVAGQQQPTRRLELTTDRVDGALGAMYRTFGHVFFHRLWLIVGIAAGVIGPALVLLELARGRHATQPTDGPTVAVGVIALVLLTLVALSIHELGHGLAVKHAGRRVNRAGVRFYLGLPTAYIDTSDIWMAPPRLRILTALAGPWTGLVLGALLGLAAVLAPDGPVAALLFLAALVFLADNLFNFNPLLELDGYYMLVDMLDRPMLRPRALAFVRGPLWHKLVHGQRLDPDERVFAWFGTLSAVYTIVAALLAVRAWQTLLLPLLTSAWSSGEVLPRLAVAIVVAAVGALIAAALARGLRWLRAPLVWLGGRAAAQRHRDALAALRAVPLWAELPEPRLLELARHMRAQDLEPGTEVVRQGERGDQFFVIARGIFEVVVGGQPAVLLGRGNYFGERALLKRAPRAASVIAVEPGRVYWIDQVTFDTLLAHDLEVRERLQARLAYRDELADMPLFRELGPAELDVLLGRIVPLTVDAGATIIRQGERGRRFYIVRSGTVEVSRDGEALAHLGAGEAFGEIALLFDVPRTASVVATKPSQLLALDADDFHDVLTSYLGRDSELRRLSHLRLRAQN